MKNVYDVSAGRVLVMMGSFGLGGAFKALIEGSFAGTLLGFTLAGALYMIGFKAIGRGAQNA
ncbi:hypothetical protein [Bacillus pretiosus]|uniref:Uncharacterized protein n=1 Tax=Bacillus pretiosus TaxID=2983392 RepID=A0ABT3EYJ1_9BACI|nr:hypothetical protein [Bacillus pretiosus]MCW1241894.1 hypothetical protein [Bacillus pretiosus]